MINEELVQKRMSRADVGGKRMVEERKQIFAEVNLR
jgi:hypothetical protein